jgi:isocitrate dehydrogenase kinase/phosphatase
MKDYIVVLLILIIAILSAALDVKWPSYIGLFVALSYFIVYPFLSARLKVYRHNRYIDKANHPLRLKLLALDIGGTYRAYYSFLEESKLEFVIIPGGRGLTITKKTALEKIKYFESFQEHQKKREFYFADLARLELEG